MILSGAGTDGTLGLKAVKEHGGLALVQQPETAQYDGMPRSAIATGLVDYVLPPDEMAAHLLDTVHPRRGDAPEELLEAAAKQVPESEPLQRIFALPH